MRYQARPPWQPKHTSLFCFPASSMASGLRKLTWCRVVRMADVAGQAAVGEDLAVLAPTARNTHDEIVELTMAHQTNFRVDLLALDEIRLTGRGRIGRFLARVIALMAGIALQVHDLPGVVGHQVPAVEGVLVAGIGFQGLIPGQ